MRSSPGGTLALVLACWTVMTGAAARATADEVQAVLGAQYGIPLGPSGTVGVLIGNTCGDCGDAVHGGMLLRLSAGQGGIKASVGLGGGFLKAPVKPVGIMLNPVAIRTWGSPVTVRGQGTYVGTELEAAYVGRLGVGVAFRVGGDASKRWLFISSIGVGF